MLGLTAKFPDNGKVKTRLAKDIGGIEAARVYRGLAERVFFSTSPDAGEYERIIFYSPAGRKNEFSVWVPGERLIAQEGEDIGEIMLNAFTALFREGAAKAVITGVDIPDLDRLIIGQAFAFLDSADVVMGPASDGGYYLIGMKAVHPEIFQGIQWSSQTVFEATAAAVRRLRLSLRVVATLYDVDNLEDLLRFRGS